MRNLPYFIAVAQYFFTETFSQILSQKSKHGLPYDPEMFSRLKLNVDELHGSRWANEQKEQIGISHSIDIMDASLIQGSELTLRVEFNLRQSWFAPDLEFPKGLFKESDANGTFVSSTDKVLQYMWSPDSYISTTRESNMNTVGTPLSLVYIFKNRTIIFKVRMFTKVTCTSSFQWYPLDTQHCDFMVESYKYQDNLVSYYWTDDRLYRPVVVTIPRLFQYELQLPVYHDNGSWPRGGKGTLYPFVRLRFRFDRMLGNNLIQVYTPTILVVVLSWFSFWLGLDAIPGRISLLVTCMLTLVTMHAGIKNTIPPVHYITMMDVWMVFCMGMVFSSMCEFIVVKYLHWRYQQKNKQRKIAPSTKSTENFVQEVISSIAGKLSTKDLLCAESMLKSILVANSKEIHEKEFIQQPEISAENAEKVGHPVWVGVDRFCRGLFPFLFFLFNAMYWPLLTHGSRQQAAASK